MKRYRNLVFSLGLVCLVAPVFGAVDLIEQSMLPVRDALDELLIKTQHVFVQRDDSVDAFHIAGTGALWVGRISITGSQSLSISISDWNKWFENAGRHKDENAARDNNQDLNKIKRLLEMDAERLNQMEQRVSMFKKELIQFVSQHWVALKNLPASESLFLVFKVADEEFASKFGTSTLMLQVSMSDLVGHTAEAERAIPESAFRFNL